MRISVIGGSGFIGHELIKLLGKLGHQTINLDIAPPHAADHGEYAQCDVTDKQALLKSLQGSDAVYLLAAEHRDDVTPVSRYYDVNVEGARNVADAMRELKIDKLIFTSSVAIYGLDGESASEDAEARPFNHYGRSKLAAEVVVREWAIENAARQLTIVRPCVIFGPRNRGNVYNLLKQISSKRFAMIGSGTNRKSMAYVGNIAAFLVTSLNSQPGIQVYNYADKPDLTVNELVTLARSNLGATNQLFRLPYALGLLAGYLFDIAALITRRRFPISAVRVQKFCANTLVNSEKAFAAGFVAPTDLKTALAITIEAEFRKESVLQ